MRSFFALLRFRFRFDSFRLSDNVDVIDTDVEVDLEVTSIS